MNLSSSGSRGRAGHRRLRGAWLSAIAVAGALALGVPTASMASVRAAGPQATAAQHRGTAAQTTKQYVIRFWPRYITYVTQNTHCTHPRLQLTAWPHDDQPAVPRGRRHQRRHALCLRDRESE